MRHRIARLGVVLAGVMSLIGLMSPPAHATKTYTIDFVGQAVLDGGLGYPAGATTSTTTTPDTKGTITFNTACGTTTTTAGVNATPDTKGGDMLPGPAFLRTQTTTSTPNCVPTVTTKPKPNGKPGPQINVTPNGGNTRTFAFFENPGQCLAAGTNINKQKPNPKLPAEAGVCDIGAGGVVTGFCGLSTGSGSGTANLVGTPQRFTFGFKFAGVGGLLLVQGTVTKVDNPALGTGNLSAVVVAAPNALGGSCTNKTATVFDIVGGATIMFKNDLP